LWLEHASRERRTPSPSAPTFCPGRATWQSVATNSAAGPMCNQICASANAATGTNYRSRRPSCSHCTSGHAGPPETGTIRITADSPRTSPRSEITGPGANQECETLTVNDATDSPSGSEREGEREERKGGREREGRTGSLNSGNRNGAHSTGYLKSNLAGFFGCRDVALELICGAGFREN